MFKGPSETGRNESLDCMLSGLKDHTTEEIRNADCVLRHLQIQTFAVSNN